MKQGRSKQPLILPNQTGASGRGLNTGYFGLSSHPLHILLFLLPIIIVYEIGSTGLIGSGIESRLEAQDMLVRFFDLLGVLGLHLPAIALVVVLLLQHIMTKESWRVVPMVLLAMIAESAFLTGPLIILVIILQPVIPAMLIQANTEQAVVMDASSNEFLQGIFLSFGAGLYEEMLFRLVLITALHFVVTDVLSFKDKTGKIIAVVLSAIAFAWLHNGVYIPGSGLNVRLALFYTLAGVYFGILFLSRGLGIAVGVHLMYDLLALVIMPGIQDPS
tara:strand:+ start:353727 stop:354551 length:825 start_codon:yes stop_codon:yes gene_type:complete